MEGNGPASTSVSELEMAHVLFMDIVAYSRLPMDQQREALKTLQNTVRENPCVTAAQARDRLLCLPTGDGMALVFFGDPERCAECALQISRNLRGHPTLKLRMGLHSGPVYRVADINAARNVAGGGINTALRVMDCGDGGHILVSASVAEVLSQLSNWRDCLYDLGDTKVKHRLRIHLYNLVTSEAGNPQVPQKLRVKSAIRRIRFLWVPSLAILAVLAFLLIKTAFLNLHQPVAHHFPIRFSAEPLDVALQTNDTQEIAVRRIRPERDLRPVYIPLDEPADMGLYTYEVSLPGSGEFQAEVIHRALQSRLVTSALHDYEYLLCIKNNPAMPFPKSFPLESQEPLIRLACGKDINSGDTRCMSTQNAVGYLMSCDDRVTHAWAAGAVVHAASPEQIREPGWVVPSLETLDKMSDRERVGYTRFDIRFTPTGAAAAADQYYSILRANDMPIYIDGFLPDKTVYPLQRGAENWITFALENLNFTGEYDGYEKINLTVVFLKNEREICRQSLERRYAALLDMPDEPPTATPVGSFTWTGKYVVPLRENKYEILLASASTPANAKRAKAIFDQSGLFVGTQRAVMVVRPPLRKPPNIVAWGLMLGLQMPTSQVQFTFNREEAQQLCHWAAKVAAQGRGGNLIRSDLKRYEVVHWGFARYAPCLN